MKGSSTLAGVEQIPPLPSPGFVLLMIEDNQDDRHLLSNLLEGQKESPCNVVFAGSISEAGRIAESESPDIVLLDLNLSDSHGLETIGRVRSLVPGVPIVVLSGHVEEGLALAAVREGAQDFLEKGRIDSWTLNRTLRYALERHRLLVALETARVRESHRAMHDPLTGIPNRALFDDRLRHALARAARHKGRLGVVYLDLDGFKPVNDRLGHAAGDEVLVEVARRLGVMVRTSDTIARLGGDEFGILFENVLDPTVTHRVARMLRARIAEPIQVHQQTCVIGASIGLAFYPDDETDPVALIQRADSRMYHEKESRRRR